MQLRSRTGGVRPFSLCFTPIFVIQSANLLAPGEIFLTFFLVRPLDEEYKEAGKIPIGKLSRSPLISLLVSI